MSMTSHASKRLSKLYHAVLQHMRELQWLMDRGLRHLVEGNARPSAATVEQFEPRLLMSTTIMLREGGGGNYVNTPFDDCYVVQGSDTANASWQSIITNASGVHKYGLMAVDNLFTLLPKTSGDSTLNITSAQLILTRYNSGSSNDTIYVDRMTSNWLPNAAGNNETNVTYKHQSLSPSQVWAGGGSISSSDYTTTDQASASWIGTYNQPDTIDITALMQDIYSTSTNYGFIIRTSNTGAGDNYFTSAYSVVASHPVLSITYTYVANNHTLTVSNGTGSGSYTQGTQVGITANQALTGQVFDAWAGDVSGLANIHTPITTLTMPASSASIRATYKSLDNAANADEGSPYTLNLSSNAPAGVSITGWTVNWGDGTGDQAITGNLSSVPHTYADGPESYLIQATATNGSQTVIAWQQQVTVLNVAPSVTIDGPATGTVGTPVTLTATATDPGINDTLSYFWSVMQDGNGYSLPTGTITNASEFTFSPDAAGDYIVTVSVTDGQSDPVVTNHSLTVEAASEVPAAPTNLAAVVHAGNIVDLTWVAPPGDGSDRDGYIIRAIPQSGGDTVEMFAAADAISFQATGFQPNTSYTIQVLSTRNGVTSDAGSGATGDSTDGNSTGITTGDGLAAVADLHIVNGTDGYVSKLMWTNPDPDATVEIEYRLPNSKNFQVLSVLQQGADSFRCSGDSEPYGYYIPPYTFRVRLIKNGESSYSSPVQVTAPPEKTTSILTYVSVAVGSDAYRVTANFEQNEQTVGSWASVEGAAVKVLDGPFPEEWVGWGGPHWAYTPQGGKIDYCLSAGDLYSTLFAGGSENLDVRLHVISWQPYPDSDTRDWPQYDYVVDECGVRTPDYVSDALPLNAVTNVIVRRDKSDGSITVAWDDPPISDNATYGVVNMGEDYSFNQDAYYTYIYPSEGTNAVTYSATEAAYLKYLYVITSPDYYSNNYQLSRSSFIDVACPDDPSNLSVSAPAADGSVDLAWNDNSYNEQGFTIERCSRDASDPNSSDNSQWVPIGSTDADEANFHVASQDWGKTYTYRVRATRSTAAIGERDSNGYAIGTASLPIKVDLYTDSDNDDVHGSPDTNPTDAEKAVKNTKPGKIMATYPAKDDGTDFKYSFVPVVFQPVDIYDATKAKFKFIITGDCGVKLWTKDGTDSSRESTEQHDDRLYPDTEYTAEQLGLSGTGGARLFVEAAKTGSFTLTFKADLAGVGGWSGDCIGEDKCLFTVIDENVSCLSCNGIGQDNSGTVERAEQNGSVSQYMGANGTQTQIGGGPHLLFLGNAVAAVLNDQARIFDWTTGPNGETLTDRSKKDPHTLLYDARSYDCPFTEIAPENGSVAGYNAAGKIVYSTGPGGTTTHYDYDAAGILTDQYEWDDGFKDILKFYYDSELNPDQVSEVDHYIQADGESDPGQLVETISYDWTGKSLTKVTVRDSKSNVTQVTYYRYYSADDPNAGMLKLCLTDDAYNRATADLGDVSQASDDDLLPYADHYYKYNADGAVTDQVSASSGCSTTCGGLGTTSFSYAVSGKPDGRNSWKTKSISQLPGYDATAPSNPQNTVVITYDNYAGQTMFQITQQTATGKILSADFYRYDDAGDQVLHADTSAISLSADATGFVDDSSNVVSLSTLEGHADLLNCRSNGDVDNYEFLRDTAGLIEKTDYYSSTTATDSNAGGVAYYEKDTAVLHGDLGAPVIQSTTDYFSHAKTTGAAPIYVTAHSTDANGLTTSYNYAWFPGTNQIQVETVTSTAVSSDHNGSGQPTSTATVYDHDGRVIWTRDAKHFLTYTAYDNATGAVLKTIQDVDTLHAHSGRDTYDATSLPSDWSTPAGGGAHLVTTYDVDSQGRTVLTTDPDGVVTRTVYNDGATINVSPTQALPTHEVRTFICDPSDPSLAIGPVQISREIFVSVPTAYQALNYSPQISESFSIDAGPVNNESVDAATVEPTADNILSYSRTYYDYGSQTMEERQYSDLTGLDYSYSSPVFDLGVKGTNYQATTYDYNRRGWLKATTDPNGTITINLYDNLGRQTSTWVGTDDSTSSGPWSPTNNPGHMVEVSGTVYDNGGVGDGNVTESRTYFGSGTSDYLATDYAYDWQDRQTDSRSSDNVATHTTYDNAGQAMETQVYADANDNFTIDSGELRAQSDYLYDELGRQYETIVHSIAPTTGVDLNDNVVTSQTWYDANGNVIKTTNPTGVFTKTSYDGAGRAVVTYTSYDASETANPTYAQAGNVDDGDTVISLTQTVYTGDQVSTIKKGTTLDNAVIVQKYSYDDAGRTTAVSTIRPISTLTGTNSDYTTTTYGYDPAGNQNVTYSPAPDGSANLIKTENILDMLGRTVSARSYIATSVNDQAPTLLAQTDYAYNAAGQLQSTTTWKVSGGSVTGTPIQTTDEYDGLGRLVKQTDSTGMFTKNVYDDYGRLLGQYVGTNEGDPSTISDDTIVSQTIPFYDNVGRVWMTATYARNVGATDTDVLTTHDARVTYDVQWFDDLGRVKADANFGTNSGTAIANQSYDFDGSGIGGGPGTNYATAHMVPNTSAYILTQYGYDGFGRNNVVTDNKGVQTKTFFDDAGRQTYVVSNYVDFDPANESTTAGGGALNDQDQVTKYVYNSAGLLSQQVALNPGRADQVTRYFYAVDLNSNHAGSPVPDGSLLRATVYPDNTATDQTIIASLNNNGGGDIVQTTYNANGSVATRTDQNGTTHQYTYNDLGQLKMDAVTAFGDNIDQTVKSVTYAYDEQGRVTSITSWPNDNGTGTICSQDVFEYDPAGWGNVTRDYQSHSGAVDANTPYVSYGYDSNGRLHSMTYPNGQVVYYNYSADGSDGTLGQLSNISTPQGALAAYTYSGGAIIQVAHPQVSGGLNLTMGLDNFGRVTDQKWTNGTGTTTLDEYTYTYDAAGNRTSRGNTQDTALSECYSYDALGRLINTNRGGSDYQNWTLDQLGNRSQFDNNGSVQTQTADAANEITGITQLTDSVGTMEDAAGQDVTSMSATLLPTQSGDQLGLMARGTFGDSVSEDSGYVVYVRAGSNSIYVRDYAGDGTWTEQQLPGIAITPGVSYDLRTEVVSVLPGDANLDGSVGPSDLALVCMNWDPSGAHANTWLDGDFNGDGKIDGADLAFIILNWSPAGYGSSMANNAMSGESGSADDAGGLTWDMIVDALTQGGTRSVDLDFNGDGVVDQGDYEWLMSYHAGEGQATGGTRNNASTSETASFSAQDLVTVVVAKVWQAGQTEPATWSACASYFGQQITSGSVGIYSGLPAGESNSGHFSNFSATIDGDTFTDSSPAEGGGTGWDWSTVVSANDVASPTYDAAGNMTFDGTLHYKYDAWNHLTAVNADDTQNPGQAGDLVATYQYDGQGHRISKTVGTGQSAVTTDYLYNENWQDVEERQGGVVSANYVWDATYIDTPVCRLGYTGGTLSQTLYYTADANHNVTSVVDASSGNVVERYYYSAYGKVTFANSDWTTMSGSLVGNTILYCGYEYNSETGNYDVRHREYDPTLGVWMQRDPLGYVDGMSAYQYVRSNPVRGCDPEGLGAEWMTQLPDGAGMPSDPAGFAGQVIVVGPEAAMRAELVRRGEPLDVRERDTIDSAQDAYDHYAIGSGRTVRLSDRLLSEFTESSWFRKERRDLLVKIDQHMNRADGSFTAFTDDIKVGPVGFVAVVEELSWISASDVNIHASFTGTATEKCIKLDGNTGDRTVEISLPLTISWKLSKMYRFYDKPWEPSERESIGAAIWRGVKDRGDAFLGGPATLFYNATTGKLQLPPSYEIRNEWSEEITIKVATQVVHKVGMRDAFKFIPRQ